jgi:hypothetical protein
MQKWSERSNHSVTKDGKPCVPCRWDQSLARGLPEKKNTWSELDLLKPNSWTYSYNFVQVSGHNLESLRYKSVSNNFCSRRGGGEENPLSEVIVKSKDAEGNSNLPREIHFFQEKIIGAPKTLKNGPILYLGLTNYTCHQKPNLSRETVPLTVWKSPHEIALRSGVVTWNFWNLGGMGQRLKVTRSPCRGTKSFSATNLLLGHVNCPIYFHDFNNNGAYKKLKCYREHFLLVARSYADGPNT